MPSTRVLIEVKGLASDLAVQLPSPRVSVERRLQCFVKQDSLFVAFAHADCGQWQTSFRGSFATGITQRC